VEAQPLPVTNVETVLFIHGRQHDADSLRFDETTHTWTAGERCARVLVVVDGILPTGLVPTGESLEPYLGVAIHGVPNLFLLTGPDVAAQKGYVAKCLEYMSRTGATRIEVRSSTQKTFHERSKRRMHRRGHSWRRVGRRIPSAFDVGSHPEENLIDEAVYEGPATLRFDDQSHDSQARLTGWLDPIDGHYHWQGTIFDNGFECKLPREVTVVVGDRESAARLTERTPWSRYSVVGVGAPPFELAEIEVEVPLL
jgi:hypothetical protein